MTDEERYTFSAVMSLLSEAENKLKQLYEALAKETDEPKLKSVLSDHDRDGSKRIEMMNRTRIESVVEFMLEPITGLKLAESISAIKTAIENQPLSGVEKAISVEKIIAALYDKASTRIMPTSADAGELLERLSRESIERACELEKYVKPS